jgi:hypothetical protein
VTDVIIKEAIPAALQTLDTFSDDEVSIESEKDDDNVVVVVVVDDDDADDAKDEANE